LTLRLRGYLTLGCVALVLLICDVIQRTIVVLAVKILPSRRSRILDLWQKFLAHAMLTLVRRVGGGDVEDPPPIPGRPGVLVLMNHQSLLDIPLVCASVRGHYPKIITRARYASGKPLISHMVRLYQYPLVDPRATTRKHLRGLAAAATEKDQPVMIFPEGTRTRDGEIGPWKRRGLERLLRARSWEVYLLVADGFWRTAKLADFLESVSTVRGRSVVLGPFTSPEPGEPLESFIDEMRARMEEGLESLRSASPS
jgi:1-acyl-sn-glycerol-3-phosphate acyltransferase